VDESNKRMKTVATALQNLHKEPHGKDVGEEEEGEDKQEDLKEVKKE